MLFPTIDFAIFFGVVYAGAWLLNSRPIAWKLWILAASYYFYAYYDWRFIFLLMASTVIAYASAVLIARTTSQPARRSIMIAGVIGLLGLLGYFKYYSFFAVNFDNVVRGINTGLLVDLLLWASPVALVALTAYSTRRTLHEHDDPAATRWLVAACAGGLGLALWLVLRARFTAWAVSLQHTHVGAAAPLFSPTLPIAISFFTFMAVSYVVDVYRRTLEPSSPLDVAVYLSFFPHLVSGPIVRGGELLPQLKGTRDPKDVDLSRACVLIMSGLFKKIAISDYLSTNVVNPVFAAPSAHSALEVIFAIWGFAIEIYADFSGYTDIAIGVAMLLGIRFPVNFDAPYTARSLQDFWRRWHITLSRWLRDYLYIPLGGSRSSMAQTYRNIMITMVLGGLWHGANWTFLVWGALHGVGQVGGHLKRSLRARAGLPAESDARWAKVWQRFFTFQYVALGWLFFNASSMSNASAMLGRLVHGWGQPSPLVTPLLIATIVGVIAIQYIPRDAIDRAIQLFGRQLAPVQAVALGLGLLVTTTLGQTGIQPFIYYKF
jgi:D-alanyl-lipoteichoic acid acyltransferase DltB (MBOAT superfamily)